MPRRRGPSVRLRLTLSYAAVVVGTGLLLLLVVRLFLLRYVPERVVSTDDFLPNRGDLTRAFVPNAVGVLVVLAVLGLAGGWLLSGRLLAPLARITAATRQVADGSLTHRIALPGRDDEFRRLADSFDGMLARLEDQMAVQRRFAANASHELRTPLAITQTLLDVARADPDADPAALVGRLAAVNGRAVELTEALLALSRADQGIDDTDVVDLSLLAEEAVETLLPSADDRGLALEADGDVAFVLGSRPLLLQLATNLVHNALVHNRTDGSGTVSVRTVLHGDRALLVVENTGEPVPAEVVASLTEPFRRGAGRSRDGDGGVGLGLAIVASIVRAHAGTLDLTPLTPGGLRVTVTLAAAAPPR